MTTRGDEDGAARRPRIAVVGATGFLGRHVLAALAGRDVDVVAASRRIPSENSPVPQGRFVEIDLHADPVDAFERLGRPDVVAHLAWGGLPNYRSLHHFESELPAQHRFLQALVRSGLKRLVVAGTCFEYGMQSGPLAESAPALPENPYGFAKDVLRRQLEFLKAAHPFELVWARLFYLHGEGQAANSLFPQLQRAVGRGDDAFDMSAGEQLRDFLPAAAAGGILADLALSDADVGIVNVCSGVPVSVRSLVERWLEEHRWSIRLNLGRHPYPSYEPLAFWGERSKLDAVLGRTPP